MDSKNSEYKDQIYDITRHSGRYPWDKAVSWKTASEDQRNTVVYHLKKKGMPVEVVAKRIGISIEEAKKYYGE